MRKKTRSSEQGIALIVVLSLVAVMTMLAMVFFSSTAAESQTSQSQSAAQSAQQLASSAAQIVMAQIQLAGNQTAPGNSAAVAWTSQPGLLRTFTVATPSSSASTVYKLYSANNMVATNYTENEDAPPSTWKSSPAIYCDLNAPVARGGTTTSLAYPIADPSVAGVVPGFTLGTAPGYSGSNPSPTNNPLPMPVRWLYVLKNGQLTTPSSVDAGGNVTFTSSEPQPSAANPIVGRVAFWADDETCKVNINTAGYARNDASYSTYWDTPVAYTQFEDTYLSNAQPWTNEFLRYPGHPATTGLNIVFDSLNLTANQTLALTPRLKDGGTTGGTIRVTTSPSTTQTTGLLKNERFLPTMDEMFYNPTRGAAAVGISSANLEARRFLITATSRAPETTLFDTPRVTIWPTWQTASKRTPTDKLIAFCSTIAGQPFYFSRNNPLSTFELLDISDNLNLYNYIQKLTERNLPGVNGNFLTKYTPVKNRDQILTSIFDAIRLANLDDRSGPEAGASTGWSYTAGALQLSSGNWTPTNPDFNVGYVAPPEGPNGTGTRGAGRSSTLAEVALLFARPSNSSNLTAGVRESDKVKAAVLFGFVTPSAGMVIPGQNRKIEVSGLSSFSVQVGNGTAQQLFGNDTFTNTQIDKGATTFFKRSFAEGFGWKGGVEWTMSSQASDASGKLIAFVPPTADLILPYDPANAAANNLNTFTLTAGTLIIKVYSPANSATPLQTFQVTFPATASVLTPMPTTLTNQAWTTSGRWGSYAYEVNLSTRGDTVVAMQSRTGDHRSEILRSGTITDFRAHPRYGQTNILSGVGSFANEFSRRASSLKVDGGYGGSTRLVPSLVTTVFGNLVDGFNGFDWTQIPALPALPSGSIQSNFPPGDFSNGPGLCPDGSWSPKTDEGKVIASSLVGTPYFRSSNANNNGGDGTTSSPNRQMPSAVFFGSIATGVYSNPIAPWQTLLFRPARAYHMGDTGHYGATSPPDCFFLDFFHMPIVEPYAISEPFSTAGKVNMNARVIPFSSYLTRETALHAVLRSTRLTAIPESMFTVDNPNPGPPSTIPSVSSRYPLNVDETLASFRDRYDGTDGSGRRVFLTAGEICSLDLVPSGSTRSTLPNFWADKRTTGDNSREQPYSALLPRLTAKSNSYTVHVTAQALAPGPGVVGWQEGRGKVLSEWRGAYTIERYVDPNDKAFTDSSDPKYIFKKDPNGFLSGTQPVGPYYKFRVLGTRRFNP